MFSSLIQSHLLLNFIHFINSLIDSLNQTIVNMEYMFTNQYHILFIMLFARDNALYHPLINHQNKIHDTIFPKDITNINPSKL